MVVGIEFQVGYEWRVYVKSGCDKKHIAER